MRIVSVAVEKEEQEFAAKAAVAFAADPSLRTYAEDDPAPGEYLAIRWNPETVLIVKLDEAHEPAAYPVRQFIGAAQLPPLKGE